jgi:hypothetical protein
VTDEAEVSALAQEFGRELLAGGRVQPELHLLIRLLTVSGSPAADRARSVLTSSAHNAVFFAAQAMQAADAVLLPALGEDTVRLLARCDRVSQFSPELQSALDAPHPTAAAPTADTQRAGTAAMQQPWPGAAAETIIAPESRKMAFSVKENLRDALRFLQREWERGQAFDAAVQKV